MANATPRKAATLRTTSLICSLMGLSASFSPASSPASASAPPLEDTALLLLPRRPPHTRSTYGSRLPSATPAIPHVVV